MSEKIVGLRIDVDTYRGTLKGVPRLLSILDKYNIKASFFFSVGPDNMGRHLFRLLKPAFFIKMLKSNAGSLYGYDILLKGTLWPGPKIGKKLKHIILDTYKQGHEIGLHAWDHHYWQSKIDKMTEEKMTEELKKGYDFLKNLLGDIEISSAAPGWKADNLTLLVKEKFNFKYNSDCRGNNIFKPIINENELKTLQIPVTLPTYDEIIGRDGITNDNYNEKIISLIKPDILNVLTIHAEAEGISLSNLFELFILKSKEKNIKFSTLGNLINLDRIENYGEIVKSEFKGREGWIGVEKPIKK